MKLRTGGYVEVVFVRLLAFGLTTSMRRAHHTLPPSIFPHPPSCFSLTHQRVVSILFFSLPSNNSFILLSVLRASGTAYLLCMRMQPAPLFDLLGGICRGGGFVQKKKKKQYIFTNKIILFFVSSAPVISLQNRLPVNFQPQSHSKLKKKKH